MPTDKDGKPDTRQRKSADGRSLARERILATAVEMFYRQGINAVGVDAIIAASGVTRSTFYRHFPGKEVLVVAYLDAEDAAIQAAFTAAAQSDVDAKALPHLLIDAIGDDVERHHTRGCPFINAAAEYPDETSAVRTTIDAHRNWFRWQLEQVLTAAEVSNPHLAAAQLVLLRDAALVGGYLDGWTRVRDGFRAAASRTLDSVQLSSD